MKIIVILKPEESDCHQVVIPDVFKPVSVPNYTFHGRPEEVLIGSSLHTQAVAVFARVCAQSTKTLEGINLKGNKTCVLMTLT